MDQKSKIYLLLFKMKTKKLILYEYRYNLDNSIPDFEHDLMSLMKVFLKILIWGSLIFCPEAWKQFKYQVAEYTSATNSLTRFSLCTICYQISMFSHFLYQGNIVEMIFFPSAQTLAWARAIVQWARALTCLAHVQLMFNPNRSDRWTHS